MKKTTMVSNYLAVSEIERDVQDAPSAAPHHALAQDAGRRTTTPQRARCKDASHLPSSPRRRMIR